MRIPPFFPLIAAALPGFSPAADRFWNVGGTGGGGIWGTGLGEKNWNTAVGAAGPNVTWPDAAVDVANFQDPVGGIVTVFGSVQASGIVLQGANYTLEGGSIALVPDLAANLPAIDVRTGVLAMGTTLEGTAGLTKAGSGELRLSGLNSYTGATMVTGGTLRLGAAGALPDATVVNLSNATALALGSANETIAGLVSNGGTISGSGVLTASSYQLNDGSTLTGRLGGGLLTTSGVVSITGSSLALDVNLAGGTLTLAGDNLADGARFGLSSGSTLVLQGSDTVGTYVSQAGSLSGPGVLTASSYLLNEGSAVAGNLGSGVLVTRGAVSFSGASSAGVIDVAAGVLDNSGVLGTHLTQLNLGSGATLIAGGTQNFALLTTSGGGSATWRGNLDNDSTVAPGGLGTAGALRVEGDFVNGPGGTLMFDVGVAASDRLDVTGSAAFGGSLELHKTGVGEIELLVPLQLIRAGSYTGNFSSLTEDLEGLVLFNPANGTITRIILDGDASLLSGVNRSHASTWLALYDDVIDPGVNNITPRPGGVPPFDLTSGFASTTDPDLLWALTASITPDGLDRALLDRLSPGVYTSLPEYALQATRTHRRSAFSAPSIAAAAVPASGSKDAKGAAVLSVPRTWEVFAAADFFDVETSGSAGRGDFGLTGAGVVTGIRTGLAGGVRVGAYFGADDGEISGRLIDAEGAGWTFGLTGEATLGQKKATRIRAGMAYGSYHFDGTRGSASATTAGWRPGLTGFSDVATEAFDVFAGIESVAYDSGTFRLIPAMGVSYTTGSSEAFREIAATAPGSPITLAVDPVHRESFLAEFSVAAEADVSRTVTLDGRVGLNAGFNDDREHVTARFSAAGRAQTVEGNLLSDDLLFIGLGATWSATDAVRIRLGYRAEFRSGAEVFNGLSLGTTIGF